MIAHIKKKAEEDGTTTQVLLEEYTLDDFLRRLSKSQYKDNLILKGGFLMTSLLGVNNRTTEDIDADVDGTDLTEQAVQEMIDSICKVIAIENDPISIMREGKIQVLHEGAAYHGYRIHLLGVLYGKSKAHVKVDISTGDVITPRQIKYSYPSLIDDTPIDIWAYNNETIVAQKLETIFTRSVFNTRMKDFYDIYRINHDRKNENYSKLVLNLPLAKKALINTAKSRNSLEDFLIRDEIDTDRFAWQEIIEELKESSMMRNRWKNYINARSYAKNLTFNMAIEAVQELMTDIWFERT